MANEKLDQLLKTIVGKKEEIQKLQDEHNKQVKDMFFDVIKEVFLIYPEVTSLGWKQYTPYFNDGEPCVFRSNHSSYFEINDYDEDGEYSGDEENPSNDIFLDENGDYSSTYKDIKDTLGKFDDDDMYNLFGNDVEVRFTKDGYTVSGYDNHD